MQLPDNDRGRPGQGRPHNVVSRDFSMIAPTYDGLGDLDALAEHLRGRFVVQVVVNVEQGHRRTHVYRNCEAAERAVERARVRGQTAHVTLVQMLPVGVVVGDVR